MKGPIVPTLSRAARLEQQAGDPRLREQCMSAQACYERRKDLLAEARMLREDAGQDERVIKSSQDYNFQIGAKGGAS